MRLVSTIVCCVLACVPDRVTLNFPLARASLYALVTSLATSLNPPTDWMTFLIVRTLAATRMVPTTALLIPQAQSPPDAHMLVVSGSSGEVPLCDTSGESSRLGCFHLSKVFWLTRASSEIDSMKDRADSSSSVLVLSSRRSNSCDVSLAN